MQGAYGSKHEAAGVPATKAGHVAVNLWVSIRLSPRSSRPPIYPSSIKKVCLCSALVCSVQSIGALTSWLRLYVYVLLFKLCTGACAYGHICARRVWEPNTNKGRDALSCLIPCPQPLHRVRSRSFYVYILDLWPGPPNTKLPAQK